MSVAKNAKNRILDREISDDNLFDCVWVAENALWGINREVRVSECRSGFA